MTNEKWFSRQQYMTFLKNNGLWIVIEGPHRAGKNTQQKLLAALFKKQGLSVLLVTEPLGLPETEAIFKNVVKRKREKKITPDEEVNEFNRARCILYRKLITPAVNKGKIVIAVRGFLSTRILQGAEGASPDKIKDAERTTFTRNGGIFPDLVIILKISYQELQRRKEKNDLSDNPFREQEEEYHQKVVSGYNIVANQIKQYGDCLTIETSRGIRKIPAIILDGNLKRERIANKILSKVLNLIKIRMAQP